MKFEVEIVLEYSDESEVSFDVTFEGSENEAEATFRMITRGTLMASMAKRAICYNKEGFDVCSYTK